VGASRELVSHLSQQISCGSLNPPSTDFVEKVNLYLPFHPLEGRGYDDVEGHSINLKCTYKQNNIRSGGFKSNTTRKYS
jgi:hypothetical protein